MSSSRVNGFFHVLIFQDSKRHLIQQSELMRRIDYDSRRWSEQNVNNVLPHAEMHLPLQLNLSLDHSPMLHCLTGMPTIM